MVKQWTPEIKNVVVNGTKSYKLILTQKQFDVLTSWMTGQLTQNKIGGKHSMCQTSVHKTLFGNIDYANKKRYGGVFKKIKKFDTGNYICGVNGYIKKA